jgi:S-adenosylmethionine:tRNA-ribosyltransferase-isomerase (queuine synthetase)
LEENPLKEISLRQGCGADTIFFCSGSDFQKVSASATALELPVITDFMLKRTFFMFLMKENLPNSHVRSYSI